MDFRKAKNFTQADLADMYNVSGPAIFKFEKGFVTPSLNLWIKISSSIGIPEKEAVLIWIKEKLPPKMQHVVSEAPSLDADAFGQELAGLSKKADALAKMREAILGNYNLSPGLKRFIAKNDIWDTLKPTCLELQFLVKLSLESPLISAEQYLDAIMIGRSIQSPND
jgi:DNA-binding XRE family transcriptional regulator